MSLARKHDVLTAVAISLLAFVVADLSHEALGHGVVARLQGARLIVLSYTYLTSDIQTRLLSAAGPLVNLGEGLIALALFRARRRHTGPAAWFLFLLIAYNLLDAAAYLIYSGALNSGDLGVVIAGLPHLGAIRAAMVVAGLALYALFTSLCARELRLFAPGHTALTTPAYILPIALDAAAALLNPLGLKYFLLSALPTTIGANIGLLLLPGLARKQEHDPPSQLTVTRSIPWIIAGLAAAAAFIFLIGPGINLGR